MRQGVWPQDGGGQREGSSGGGGGDVGQERVAVVPKGFAMLHFLHTVRRGQFLHQDEAWCVCVCGSREETHVVRYEHTPITTSDEHKQNKRAHKAMRRWEGRTAEEWRKVA